MSRGMRVKRETALTYQAIATADSPVTSDEIVNYLGYTTLIVRLFADSELNTSTLDVKMQAYNEVSDDWYDIPGASFAQVSANMTTPVDLVISPAIAAVANRAVSQVVPQRVRAYVAVAGASGGFSVSIEYELHP